MAPSEFQSAVSAALVRLQAVQSSAEQPPAVVVLPPDSGKFMVGNSSGFVQLAIAALKAAQGESQPFERLSWIREADLDWTVRGFEPDPDAGAFFPASTRTQPQRIFRGALALLLVICFVVGFVSIATWLFHSFIR